MQEYIYKNPDVIPIYDINEDARLFIAAREFSTNSGLIDALGFDENGNIYVIEAKLFKNPDKRKVVAQALDYGASLWRHSIDFDQFISQLNKKTSEQFNVNFEQAYKNFFELENVDNNLENIKNNLEHGSIKFVILMDYLEDRLKDLITYVNQNSKFDIYAVDLEYYKHDQFEIIIPKIYGSEVKKNLTQPNKEAREWDEETFMYEVDNNRDLVSPEEAQVVHKVLNWVQSQPIDINWGGRGSKHGSCYFTFNDLENRLVDGRPFVMLSTEGWLRINIRYLKSDNDKIIFYDLLKQEAGIDYSQDLDKRFLEIGPKKNTDGVLIALEKFMKLGE